MKNSIYLAMNYWPKEDYWLCAEFGKRHITYRLIGIDNKVRMLRYTKMGGAIWKILRFIHAIKIAVRTKKDEIVVVMDDTLSSVFIFMHPVFTREEEQRDLSQYDGFS